MQLQFLTAENLPQKSSKSYWPVSAGVRVEEGHGCSCHIDEDLYPRPLPTFSLFHCEMKCIREGEVSYLGILFPGMMWVTLMTGVSV